MPSPRWRPTMKIICDAFGTVHLPHESTLKESLVRLFDKLGFDLQHHRPTLRIVLCCIIIFPDSLRYITLRKGCSTHALFLQLLYSTSYLTSSLCYCYRVLPHFAFQRRSTIGDLRESLSHVLKNSCTVIYYIFVITRS